MKWVAISGSWRTTNQQVEDDVRAHVSTIIKKGDGIVTGGALGVDFIATDEVLKHDPLAQSIKIILPTPLTVYRSHYLQKAQEGIITMTQATKLVVQLESVQKSSPRSLIEMFYTACNPQTYYARNTAVLDAASELLAFQVNDSQGTQDTIDKALALGYPVQHLKYKI